MFPGLSLLVCMNEPAKEFKFQVPLFEIQNLSASFFVCFVFFTFFET